MEACGLVTLSPSFGALEKFQENFNFCKNRHLKQQADKSEEGKSI
jgi:hypothetical protein